MAREKSGKKPRKAARRKKSDPLSLAQGKVVGSLRRRHKDKLSQKQLAQRSGLSVGVIGDLERGRRPIRGRELIRICHALGVPFSAVLEEMRAAQAEAIRPLDEEIRRERGESLPAAESVPAAGSPSFGWEGGKQGLYFWGVAGDQLSVLQVMTRAMVQSAPLPDSPEEVDPEGSASR